MLRGGGRNQRGAARAGGAGLWAGLGIGAIYLLVFIYGCGTWIQESDRSDEAATPPSQGSNQGSGQQSSGQGQGGQAQNNQQTNGAAQQQTPANASSSKPLMQAVEVGSEDDLQRAVRDYYYAVDREDWDYTLNNLDQQTRSSFTRQEWRDKNQYLSDQGSGLDSLDVQDSMPTSSDNNVADVFVKRTFKDGSTETRQTYFVYENGKWLHRFGREEKDLFQPGVPFSKWSPPQ